ncbi:hypothetical protein [uncultured Nitratireductor sp.]|uniref:hypothetical protein n=1 Tax=uncultured Nitratireductor sp. TaxID=520953 RepID=UPI0025FE2E2D|nr:hypothetical protein [uncultured Nitratireductor sp.]
MKSGTLATGLLVMTGAVTLHAAAETALIDLPRHVRSTIAAMKPKLHARFSELTHVTPNVSEAVLSMNATDWTPERKRKAAEATQAILAIPVSMVSPDNSSVYVPDGNGGRMTLNIDSAIKLIGHSSDHPGLDTLLNDAGIEKRPDDNDFASMQIETDNGAVVLQFTAVYQDNYGPPHSEGPITLEDVTVQNRRFEEGIGPFTGTLPLGLRLDMTQGEIIELLGEPTSSMEFLGGFFLTYDGLLPDLTMNIRLDLESQIIHFVRFMPVEISTD